jgi:hypothetical protein
MESVMRNIKFWTYLLLAVALTFSKVSNAAITDLKVSTAQIFDVQWSISGGRLNASGFNYIYASVNYATQTSSAARWTAAQTAEANSNGRYIGFFNSTTHPGTYGMAVFNSDGTRFKTINNTGSFRALADGAIFYNGAGMWGTLITTGQGYNLGQSGSWAVTQDNPTNSHLQAYTPPSSTPLAAGQTAAPPPPTTDFRNIYTNSSNLFITNIYPTSNNSPAGEGATNAFDNNPNTKYLNFDKKNAGVTIKLSQGRVVKGFTITTANDFPGRDPTSYKLFGSNNGTNWTLLSEGALSLSNNRFTVSAETTISNTNAYVYYYMFFPTTKSGDGCGLDCDSMQIAEITYIYDNNNTTTSVDTGTGSVANPSDFCCGGTAAPFNANTQFSNRVAAFNSRPLQDAKVSITQIGNSNSATVQQTGTRNNYSEIYVQGNNNITNTTQSSTSNSARNYIELDVLGSNNTVNLTQSSTGGSKGIMATVNNASNSVTVNQNNNGNHYAEITLSNSNKSVNLTQSGSAAHMAKIELSGGATSITATQNGSTQLYYSITHNCAQASCAAISVTQGN